MFSWLAMFFFFFFAGFCSFVYILHALQSKHTQNSDPLPPGPPGLPIIGHLHIFHNSDNLPYHTLHKLSQKYGPIIHIRLGSVPTVVVSSTKIADLFLKTHDLFFAHRPKSQVSGCTLIGSKGMLFSAYGPYLRDIRKLINVHLLSASKVESFRPMREEEVQGFIENLKGPAESRQVVNIRAHVGSLTETITYKMIFGRAYKAMFHFQPCVQEAMWLAGAFNIADFLPFLKPFDVQGLTRRTKNVVKIMDDFLEKIIDEHERDARGRQEHEQDFIDILLSFMKSDNPREAMFDKTNIKVVIIDMLGAAMESPVTTLEWVLKELLRHPQVMKRVQEELENVIGMDRMVEENDLAKLPYLNMVVKESMRLHPIAPLLPRESMEDISIQGFHIPKKSRILINAWAMARDPNLWSENAEEFYPERFANSDIDIQGHHIQLIPFGSGRRMCPGMDMGFRTVQFLLAQLVHCFNLELPEGKSPGDVDMQETFGLTVGRANPLFLVPTYRLHI